MLRLIPRLSSLVFLLGAFAASASSLLEDGAHCVAYRAEKVSFFVAKSDVVGKNCDVSAQVLPEVGGLYHIEVNVPVRGFNSGDSERDHDVANLLKVSERPELTFRTTARTVAQWKELFSKGDFVLEGTLTIGQKSFPIQVRSHYASKPDVAEIDGVANVAFKDFDLDPPRIVGGVVAKAKPGLELHFHLLSNRILGADSIRLGPQEKSTL